MKELDHDEDQPEATERRSEKSKQIWERIEEMLIQNDRENEDNFNLSKAQTNHVNVEYDMKSLVKSEFVQDVDPDLADQSMTD